MDYLIWPLLAAFIVTCVAAMRIMRRKRVEGMIEIVAEAYRAGQDAGQPEPGAFDRRGEMSENPIVSFWRRIGALPLLTEEVRNRAALRAKLDEIYERRHVSMRDRYSVVVSWLSDERLAELLKAEEGE
jgi:hypothetical protein